MTNYEVLRAFDDQIEKLRVASAMFLADRANPELSGRDGWESLAVLALISRSAQDEYKPQLDAVTVTEGLFWKDLSRDEAHEIVGGRSLDDARAVDLALRECCNGIVHRSWHRADNRRLLSNHSTDEGHHRIWMAWSNQAGTSWKCAQFEVGRLIEVLDAFRDRVHVVAPQP